MKNYNIKKSKFYAKIFIVNMAIHLTSQKILKDWTDYNNHMNVAYYVLIFDLNGAEKLMTTFEFVAISIDPFSGTVDCKNGGNWSESC